jgi:hypothetical protein
MKPASLVILFLIISCFFSCRTGTSKHPQTTYTDSPDIIHQLNIELTEAILQDGFSPPVASRIYAYANIAAYEAIRNADSNFVSLKGQLNGLQELPAVETNKNYDFTVSMIEAFCEVGSYTVYRGYILDDIKKKYLANFKERDAPEVYNQSIEYGQRLAKAIITWAQKDGYTETRNMPLFVCEKKPGAWEATPPKYGEAMEPHWMMVRPFVMDSAREFQVPPPPLFSTEKNSTFYQMAKEVYDSSKYLDSSRYQVSKFWDCNPVLSVQQGHFTYFQRQLTPGGHWIGITRLAAKMKNLNLIQSCEIYTRVSLGLADAFIAIWATKYDCDLIRPETYINRYIDAHWRPYLETPMFPEYSSGHAAISKVSAQILTNYFGDHFEFVDSSERDYSALPERRFESFNDAANEAAISRFYGGIHYRISLDAGAEQGRKVGDLVNHKIVTRRKVSKP